MSDHKLEGIIPDPNQVMVSAHMSVTIGEKTVEYSSVVSTIATNSMQLQTALGAAWASLAVQIKEFKKEAL